MSAPADHRALPGVRQLLWIVPRRSRSTATIQRYTFGRSGWRKVGSAIPVTIGYKGFAPLGKKREGDQRTPSGIYPMDHAFGYGHRRLGRLAYRRATLEDKFIDDPRSAQYNTWVSGSTAARSFERMRREDNQYEYGIVLRYNRDPVRRGHGSAIFLHIWTGAGQGTQGCVAMSRPAIRTLLRWLNPAKKPHVVLNPVGPVP